MSRVLVVDDDAAIRTVVGQALRRAGHEVTTVETLAAAGRALAAAPPDVLVTDVVLPDGDGLDHLASVCDRHPALPVIVLSARNTLTTAVRAAEAGAYEYLPKPFDLDALVRAVAGALVRTGSAPEPVSDEDATLPLIGRSPAMQDVYRVIARVVATDLTVLVSGESGTGKELVARAIHDLGRRRAAPFVVTEAHRGCMRCPNCLRGAYTDCLNNGDRAKGHRVLGMTVDGGMAEYALNHVSTLQALPDSVSFDEAVALTTAGTVMHAFDALHGLVVGASVAVIGPGPIGLLAVQVARELGADFVALVGTRDARLAIGKDYGADLLINARTEDPVLAVRAATAGRGVDIVLECSGAGPSVDVALGMAKRSAAVVLVGFFDEPVTVGLNAAVMNGITLHAIRGEGSGSIQRAVSLAGQGRLRTRDLITHHVQLAEVAHAFELYADRSHNAIKVMIDVAER